MENNENDFEKKDEDMMSQDEQGENKPTEDGTYSYTNVEKTRISPNDYDEEQKKEERRDEGVHVYTSNPDYDRYTQSMYTPPEPKKKKKSSTAAIICVCVAVCLILSAASFALGTFLSRNESENDPPVGTSPSTDTNGVNNSIGTGRSDVTLAYNEEVPKGDESTSVGGFPSSNEVSAKSVASKIVNSVVEIQTESIVNNTYFGQYVQEGAGSGVIVSADGFIATNYHVIDGATKITVRLRSGDEYSATLWGYDIKNDLAVVKIEASGLSYATFGNSDLLVVGDNVLAVGNPLGELGGSVTSGIISALERQVSVENKTMTLLQTDTSVNPGNSGGGLFTYSGELIGIVNAKSSGTGIEGIAFAIPANTARPIIQDIIENRSTTQKAYLGISVDYDRNYGVYVKAVTKGSDAEKAGLQVNDVILYVDETRIDSTSGLSATISSYYVGDTVSIVVWRGRTTVTLEVTFTENTSTE